MLSLSRKGDKKRRPREEVGTGWAFPYIFLPLGVAQKRLTEIAGGEAVADDRQSTSPERNRETSCPGTCGGCRSYQKDTAGSQDREQRGDQAGQERKTSRKLDLSSLEGLEESEMTDQEIRARDAIVNGDSSVEYSA